MKRLSTEKREQVVRCLVEGNSIRATVRMTGVAKATVTKLLVDLGDVCAKYQDENLRNLPCCRIQADEIWAFCYSKAKNVPADKRGQFGYGDVWTWTGICADTKLIVSFLVGNRDVIDATRFMDDLASRLTTRVQLTTDGHKPYLQAVDAAFGGKIDYATLVKLYGNVAPRDTAARYSAPVCIGTERRVRTGYPDKSQISTSYIERQNLTMRMSMRRFTRLTNAFSKKVENLTAAVSLHFMYYNFVRVHSTIGMTPAQAAGVTDHPWTLAELIGLLQEAEDRVPRKRGPYKPRQPKAISN
jgi:IS1 family transposase